jgi:radical SAM protein with 4Fe4S-binding SPASM domain
MSEHGGGLHSYLDYQKKLREKNIPSEVMLEITYLCNLRCQYCYNPTHEAIGEMSTKDILFCFDELAKLGVPKITLTGGECMAHRDFFLLLEEALKRQFSVEVFTNATLIDKPTAERLKDYPIRQVSTSIHGDNAATHDKQTCVPGSFDKLIKALEHLEGAPFPRELKCTVTRMCQEELRGIKAIGDRTGCETKFSLSVKPRDNGDMSPLDEAVTEEFRERYYSEEYDDIRMGGVEEPQEHAEGAPICGAGLSQFAIDPYGNVYPCVVWRQFIGNILKDGVEKIWQNGNQPLQEIREITKRVPVESMTPEELEFVHYCPGYSQRAAGNPMHLFDYEREEIEMRRRRYLAEIEAMKKDPTRRRLTSLL